MDFAMAALTSFSAILAAMDTLIEGLLLLTIQALAMQERVGLQKSIQFLVSGIQFVRQ